MRIIGAKNITNENYKGIVQTIEVTVQGERDVYDMTLDLWLDEDQVDMAEWVVSKIIDRIVV